jgi:hypothetical protein
MTNAPQDVVCKSRDRPANHEAKTAGSAEAALLSDLRSGDRVTLSINGEALEGIVEFTMPSKKAFRPSR